MAKKPKKATELKEPEVAYERTTETVYLTKRILERAVQKGAKNMEQDYIDKLGYYMMVEDGWVIKVLQNGSKERISKVAKSVSKSPINLD